MNVIILPAKLRLIKFVVLAALLLAVLTTCERPERIVKVITLDAVTGDITYTTATLKGEISDIGNEPIDDHGIFVSVNPTPILSNSLYEPLGSVSKKGSFQFQYTGLEKNTLYYYRAVAFVSSQPVYGNTLNFRTKDTQTAVVTAGTVSSVSMSSATLNGEVTSDGGESSTKRGICWGTASNPTITNCLDTTVNGSGTGIFTGTMNGLAAGTQYYVRTYATNSKGTIYNSADIVFKTHDYPEVTTTAVTNITGTGATSGGEVTDDGEVSVTARGVCWNTTTGPTVALPTKTIDGSGKGVFPSTITGLNPGTLYYVRAYATNQYGTSYGSELPFTAAKAPLATTNPATLIR